MTPSTTIAQAIREAAQRLEATSDTARLDAEVLMAHALGVTRSDLLLRHMRDEVPASFAALIERRAGHEPVAYITGHQEFYGRDFLVGPDVLIPRGDSETIVDAALDACPAPVRVLDCGVGSGALLLSVLAERPGAQGVGIDRSQGALALAAANAQRLGLAARARMEQRDWTQSGWADELGRFDCILANPPYVESKAELAPSVREFEPSGALFAGPDGLDDYRVLVPQLPKLLSPDGIAVLEIGWSQADAVRQLSEEAGFSAILHKDLAGRPRALLLRFCAWQCLG
ncbi:MAG TPA: peptide chain release factor N(5)-glutamine methyltransferase [Sphingomonadaceae bacterium]|nr:peptide chain release factor N(5)-glutamine methyltransferase [Sphingomonadaceae bacterium]